MPRAPSNIRPAALAPGAAVLFAAREGFHKRWPHRSAKYVLSLGQWIALMAIAAAIIASALNWPSQTARAAHDILYALFALAILWRLLAAIRLAPLLHRLYSPRRDADWPLYTILCPLYREADVVFDLVASLERLDYPKHRLEILLLVEDDDVETFAAALAAASARHVTVLAIPPAEPRTKPKALNVGLAAARGEYLVVYDAEDRPHPQQLRAALAAFEDGEENLACVQAPLAIDNAADSWLATQFAAEYAIQFREILPMLARMGLPMPLGGTSNHFKTRALRRCGGWDSYNVTEDADLGYRLAAAGKKVGIIAPPTWEEAPITFDAWLNQRTRWIKGHLHTWAILMRDPVASVRDMGLAAFLSMQIVLGLGVLAAFAHGPLAAIVFIAAVSPFDILGPADWTLALSGYGVAALCAVGAAALARDWRLARAALLMPLYWPLASIAAWRALWQLLRRPHHWSKTRHGVSRAREAQADLEPAAPAPEILSDSDWRAIG